MLKGRESLIRLVGKRRRLLPNRQSLFSTNPEISHSNSLKEVNGGNGDANGGNSDAHGGNGDNKDGGDCRDWVTCPVCGNAIRGDDSMINSHLDECLARGTKRKLTQRTLLHFSFSPISKEKNVIGKLKNVETRVTESNHDENHTESSIPVLPEVGGNPTLKSIINLESCQEEYIGTLSRGDFVSDSKEDTVTVLPISETAKLSNGIINDASVDVLETFIVGRRFGDEVELKQGDTISLSRDPNNIKDACAIKVLSANSDYTKVLGYLPRELARCLSPLIERFNLDFKGSVLSLPKHSLDVVPVQIFCEEIPSHPEENSNDCKDFESLWRSVLSVVERMKISPPNTAKYQKRFCIILQEVMKNHHHLFTNDEKLFIESFKALSDDSQRLFVRLYTRKGPWFRMSNVSYPEIIDHQQAIKELCEMNYMCSLESMKLNGYDIKEVLEALNASEIRDILRATHLKIQKESTRKQDLIALLSTSYEDGVCPSLPRLVLDQTGTCVQISPTADSLFWRLQRLFFLNGDQDLSSFLLVDLGLVKYPTYNCIITNHIFPERADLLAYEEAIEVAQVMDQSVEENNIEMVLKCIEISEGRISTSPDSAATFTSFFSASWVYSKVLTLGVSFLEREKKYKDAIKLLKSLLSRIKSGGRRGYWTLRLSMDLEHIGHLDESLSVAEEGLLDSWVRAGSRMALQRRVLRLGKPPRRWKIPNFAESIKRKIKEVHVMGRPLNCDGLKNRFYDGDGDQCGVEELALQYYAGEGGGGWQGVHTETGIWVTIFGLLMWDVIFTDIPDVFHTRFQTAPLDLDTDNFYISRKTLIESHLEKIQGGMAEELLITSWESHFGTSCRGVNWDRHSLSDLRAAVTCVGGPCLASLCRLLAQDYRSWARGMPDLFLWRFVGEYRGEAKLVEVKGPRDRLSEQQRAWLLLLMDCGFNAEVCKVSPQGGPST
ncbi:phosphodiesterase I [Ranunculus cassubicifolius]